MIKNKIYLTKDGLLELQREYEDLTSIERPKVLEQLQAARELGDLKENGMYTVARERQSFVEGRIRELEDILKKAQVVEDDSDTKIKSNKDKVVGVGREVHLEVQKNKFKYFIVGVEEVDFANGKISYESPLGQAMIGRKIGDLVKVAAPAGSIEYKIIDIK